MSKRGENIYKRKDGRWEGRYIRNRRLDGSIHYGYVYASTYKEVKHKLIPLKQEKKSVSRSCDGGSQSLCSWLRTWLHQRRNEVKTSTFSTYKYKLQKYVIPKIGEIELSELTSQTIQELVDSWQHESNLAPTTITSTFHILQNALSTAFKQGILLMDICEDIVLPKKIKKVIRALSQKEQIKLEKEAQCSINGLPILLSLYTGLRIGEISALTWEDIDFNNQVLHVQNTYQRVQTTMTGKKTQLLLSDAKSTASHRMIPLSKKLFSMLVIEKEKSQSTFIISCNNRPMEPRLINYHFKKIVKKAGLKDIHFHQLRHTFATRCMEITGDVASISSLLGHSSAKTTLDVYVDSFDKQRRRIISDMEKLIKV